MGRSEPKVTDIQEFPATEHQGRTTVGGWGANVSIETSLATMYDEGRRAGLSEGIAKGRAEEKRRADSRIREVQSQSDERAERRYRLGIEQGKNEALNAMTAMLRQAVFPPEPIDLDEDDD